MTITTDSPNQSITARWGRALAAHFLIAIIGMAVWGIFLSLLVAGVSTLIVWVGLPILALTLVLAHGYAQMRKVMVRWQTGEDWEDLPPIPPKKPSALAWIWATIRSPDRWRELGYILLGVLLEWILAIVAISFVGAGPSEFLSAFFPWMNGLVGLLAYSPLPIAGWILSLGDIILGFVFLVLAIPAVWLCAKAQIAITRAFLAPSRQAITSRLARVEYAKVAGEQAETAHLTRIERDLHDGPQQSLIRTGLDLASLERRLDAGDTDGARALLSEVRDRNEDTLQEIRTLSRGFAPPILAESGLKHAIQSVAATSSIPTSVTSDMTGERPPDAIERAIYFAVCEALANAAKHSGATKLHINLVQTLFAITASVTDNGTGGAALLPGHGLAGIKERLDSVGGFLSVESPADGGTMLNVGVTLR
ncbi:MAG: sensor domain-containing protein [Propionibacteriaceae bacterium]|nr:sensor domain-containing protein [Propionibacteriaceae bacterium]